MMIVSAFGISRPLDDRWWLRRTIGFTGDELGHDLLQVVGVHLAVAHIDLCLGHELLEFLRDVVDRVDAIMEKIDS